MCKRPRPSRAIKNAKSVCAGSADGADRKFVSSVRTASAVSVLCWHRTALDVLFPVRVRTAQQTPKLFVFYPQQKLPFGSPRLKIFSPPEILL